jgi:hypothetical protein
MSARRRAFKEIQHFSGGRKRRRSQKRITQRNRAFMISFGIARMGRNAILVFIVVISAIVIGVARAELTEAQCRACTNSQQICGATACESCTQDTQCQLQLGSVSVCRSANDSRAECDIAGGCLCAHKSLVSDGISFSDLGPAILMIIGGAAAAGKFRKMFFLLPRCIFYLHFCDQFFASYYVLNFSSFTFF